MTLGTILGASFRVLRRNPRPVFGFSLIIHAIVLLITLLITGFFTVNALNGYFQVLSTGTVDKATASSAIGSFALAEVGAVVTGLFAYAGQAILQGIVTMDVARGTLGEKLPLRALWGRARGRILVLVGWALLVVAVALVTLVVLVGADVLLFAIGGATGITIGVILLILILLGGAVLAALLWTRLSLVPSALVLERLPLGKAIRRSWSLTRGFFWRTFGIELLVAVIVGIAASIVELPVTTVVEILTLLANPTSTPTASGLTSVFGATEIAGSVASAIAETVTAIIATASTALIYIDLRMRKEGLDLQLVRFVDARAAGQTDVPDPYLPALAAAPGEDPGAASA
ncbi:MAG TPA: hypothetical protein VHZ98_02120 [Galbitalea sp.]|jgi:hypothetical protein|nr:hypothetical protein [Galbitalea sp.]